jgi:hypothetical protein
MVGIIRKLSVYDCLIGVVMKGHRCPSGRTYCGGPPGPPGILRPISLVTTRKDAGIRIEAEVADFNRPKGRRS